MDSVQSVLVTGANGFIGQTLMRYYQSQGVKAVGVDLNGRGNDIFVGDIAKPEQWGHLLDQAQVVIHTAALVSNAMKDEDMWRVNMYCPPVI